MLSSGLRAWGPIMREGATRYPWTSSKLLLKIATELLLQCENMLTVTSVTTIHPPWKTRLAGSEELLGEWRFVSHRARILASVQRRPSLP